MQNFNDLNIFLEFYYLFRNVLYIQPNLGTMLSGQASCSQKRRHESSTVRDIKKGKFSVNTCFNKQTINPIDELTNFINYSKQTTNSVDNLSIEAICLYNKFKQIDQTYFIKMGIKHMIERKIQLHFDEALVFIIGSSNSGFGIEDSDLDICLFLPHLYENDNRRIVSTLFHIRNLFKNLTPVRSTFVIPARVPILKFIDLKNDIEVDMNINNIVGVHNTFLLRAYYHTDDRVGPLIVLVKYWARYHDINDASRQGISSYSLALMVINFLQVKCSPPVLPALQQLYPRLFDTRKNMMRHFADFENLKRQLSWKSENIESFGQLLPKFFRYYSDEFDFQKNAASVRLGCVLPRDQVNSNIPNIKQRNNQSWKYICVEEPFDKTNTAYSTYNTNIFKRFQRAFKFTADNLEVNPGIASIFKALPPL